MSIEVESGEPRQLPAGPVIRNIQPSPMSLRCITTLSGSLRHLRNYSPLNMFPSQLAATEHGSRNGTRPSPFSQSARRTRLSTYIIIAARSPSISLPRSLRVMHVPSGPSPGHPVARNWQRRVSTRRWGYGRRRERRVNGSALVRLRAMRTKSRALRTRQRGRSWPRAGETRAYGYGKVSRM